MVKKYKIFKGINRLIIGTKNDPRPPSLEIIS